MLDLVCVADTATLLLAKDIYVRKHAPEHLMEMFKDSGFDQAIITTMFHREPSPYAPGTPKDDVFGALTYGVTRSLAYEYPELRPLADYLRELGQWSGIGRVSTWHGPMFSPDVAKRVRQGKFDDSLWSKWSSSF